MKIIYFDCASVALKPQQPTEKMAQYRASHNKRKENSWMNGVFKQSECLIRPHNEYEEIFPHKNWRKEDNKTVGIFLFGKKNLKENPNGERQCNIKNV